MASYALSVNQDTCIGCALCAELSDQFVMKGDGKASPKKRVVNVSNEPSLSKIKEAEQNCPVEAIKVAKKG